MGAATPVWKGTGILQRVRYWHELTMAAGRLKVELMRDLGTDERQFPQLVELYLALPPDRQRHKPAHKPKKKTKPLSKGAQKEAMKGRAEVASGQRPPIKNAICRVLGDKEMGAQEIFDKITEKGWLPRSRHPRAYIGNILSAQKDLFPPVKRGLYRRAKDWEQQLTPMNKKGASKKTPPLPPERTPKLSASILAHLQRMGTRQRATKMAAALKESPHAVRAALVEMSNQGVVKKESANSAVYWRALGALGQTTANGKTVAHGG